MSGPRNRNLRISNPSTPGKRSRVTKKMKLPKQVRTNRFGFPDQMTSTLRYSQYFFQNSASGAMTVTPIHANSMYDPYQPAGGHQPMYYDNLMLIYNHWVVLKATMKITWVGTTTSEVPCVVGVYVNDDATTVPSGYTAACEQSSARFSIMPSSATDLPVTIYAPPYDAVKTFGPNPMGNSALRGAAGSNPTETNFWSVFMAVIDGSSTASAYCKIDVTYTAVFFELKDQAEN